MIVYGVFYREDDGHMELELLFKHREDAEKRCKDIWYADPKVRAFYVEEKYNEDWWC